MKIKKQPIDRKNNVNRRKSRSVTASVIDSVPSSKMINLTPAANDCINDPYDIACCCIQDAIESLTKIADRDVVAAESIANLAVVLLDLSSNQ